MLATAIIAKTRDKRELQDLEIEFMMQGMLRGEIPDYQVAAWLMAILCRGFTRRETTILTRCMLESGTVLPRVSDRPRVDKHSTGGLGDKTSLILAPILAACGAEVPMLSGRGLGITGGTLDKLEAYAGFRTDLSEDEIGVALKTTGCVITGASPSIAPADRQLYALRDVTGTVPSVALITASILSKKLAESLDALVLDVKFGSGTFMKELTQAAELAASLESTAEQAGLATQLVLSSMEQPLGEMVGNACECNESVEVLQGQGPADVQELTIHLASVLLQSSGLAPTLEAAKSKARESIDSGAALELFRKMIEQQGGSYQEQLGLAPSREVLWEGESGVVEAIDGETIGNTVISLGGGRRKKGEAIDPSVGIRMKVGLGTELEAGQPIAEVFTRSSAHFEAAAIAIRNSIRTTLETPEPFQLIREPPPN